MTTDARHGPNWRLIGWGAAAALLALPALAMRVTAEMNWDAFDFLVWGAMLLAAGGVIELGARVRGGASRPAYQGGVAVATFAAFLLVWVDLAVGVIGDEGHPANLLFAGVLALVVGGAVLARGRAPGLARTMLAAAAAQALIALAATAMRWGAGSPTWPADLLGGAAVFTTLWLLAAFLFARAAR